MGFALKKVLLLLVMKENLVNGGKFCLLPLPRLTVGDFSQFFVTNPSNWVVFFGFSFDKEGLS